MFRIIADWKSFGTTASTFEEANNLPIATSYGDAQSPIKEAGDNWKHAVIGQLQEVNGYTVYQSIFRLKFPTERILSIGKAQLKIFIAARSSSSGTSPIQQNKFNVRVVEGFRRYTPAELKTKPLLRQIEYGYNEFDINPALFPQGELFIIVSELEQEEGIKEEPDVFFLYMGESEFSGVTLTLTELILKVPPLQFPHIIKYKTALVQVNSGTMESIYPAKNAIQSLDQHPRLGAISGIRDGALKIKQFHVVYGGDFLEFLNPTNPYKTRLTIEFDPEHIDRSIIQAFRLENVNGTMKTLREGSFTKAFFIGSQMFIDVLIEPNKNFFYILQGKMPIQAVDFIPDKMPKPLRLEEINGGILVKGYAGTFNGLLD